MEPEARDRLLTEIFNSCRPRALRYLKGAFPRLADEAEDILQDAWLEIYSRRAEMELDPPRKLENYILSLVRSRAIDRLREFERRIFRSWQTSSPADSQAHDPEPVEARTPLPSSQVAERERRAKQGLLLSEVLTEFCRWCEKRPQRLAIKETFERSLRGQSPGDIAAAMGVAPASVYQWLHQAREWVRRRVMEKDVDRSVFLTLYGGKATGGT
ncbi:MAG: sigma-70 family RNA polymerase sigma factor [Thermoguttaceae bacterium]|nr:sigma-70 family RNA polymerase sigma factor [Thermoguttaceae bacterium]MDW8079418.1 sigma-70 family RNA polymerase sigma factor [Thermoguttaceae bacterium]